MFSHEHRSQQSRETCASIVWCRCQSYLTRSCCRDHWAWREHPVSVTVPPSGGWNPDGLDVGADPGEVAESQQGGVGEHHRGDALELHRVVSVAVAGQPGLSLEGIVGCDDADEDQGMGNTSRDDREHCCND